MGLALKENRILTKNILTVMTQTKPLSLSRQSASKTVYAVFNILKNAGGQMSGSEVIDKVRETVELTDWEKHQYTKTGYIRWESILHFYSIDCIKAGFLRKINGIWYLTEEGEKAMEGGALALHNAASKAYKEWALENRQKKTSQSSNNVDSLIDEEPDEIEDNISQAQKATLEQLSNQAKSGIKGYINRKNPYEFQDLVAALLRGMKYHTPFISPKGKDGGIDIIAFQDPLGATTPRIKVQVKHRPDSSVNVNDIRSLIGLLNKDGDIGLFVTSGNFTSEAERFSRDSHIHVKLIDIDIFISLWKENYTHLNDEEKNMLPLQPIYFLGSNE